MKIIPASTKRSRRDALRYLAATAFAALAPHVGRGQAVPLGDGSPLNELGMPLSEEQRAKGVAFLKRHVSVDTHSHPGRFFLRDLNFETPTTRAFGAPFEASAVADLLAGQVTATLMAVVADTRLLEPTSTGGLHAGKDFQAGEAYADYRGQIKQLKRLAAQYELARGLSCSDISAAKKRGRPAAVFAVEGGDFIEDRLERIHEAHADGVRAVTLVHYHINQIGDIQTEAAVHNGLTPLGKSIVREMNQAGILPDLAHATFAVTKDAVQVSDKPILVSHTNLATASMTHPRFISGEHAKLVAQAGGIIGSWPSGFGLTNFADYIEAIQRLVDLIGPDHVVIGTDMDANFKPVLKSYRDWGLIPAALLARGFSEEDTAKIMGGNFMRVFAANSPGHRHT
jgi:membrane dipeptidase